MLEVLEGVGIGNRMTGMVADTIVDLGIAQKVRVGVTLRYRAFVIRRGSKTQAGGIVRGQWCCMVVGVARVCLVSGRVEW